MAEPAYPSTHMRRGPVPKSVEQRRAEGDLADRGSTSFKKLRKEKSKQALAREVSDGIPREPPVHLSARAKQKWRQLVPMIEKMKISNRPDACVFEGLCVNYGVYIEAYEHVQEHGVMLEEPILAYSTVDGERVAEVVGYKRKANPACNVMFKAEAEVRRTA